MKSQYTPKEFKEYLDKTVRGQEQAKKAASILLYNHCRGIKDNILFIGPSGCGKTQIWRSLKEIYPAIYIFDVSGMSQKGYTGEKKADSFLQQMLADGLSKSQIEHSIIVFDEFDKVCIPEIGSGGTNHTYNMQAEFLSMVEGTKMSVKTTGSESLGYDRMTNIDTSHMSFVFLGAFEDLYKARDEIKTFGFNSGADTNGESVSVTFNAAEVDTDEVIRYGLRTELAGRIGDIVTLEKLSKDDYTYILKTPSMSPIAFFADQYQMDIRISRPFMDEVVDKAYKKPTGVRGLRTEIKKYINEEIYEPGSTSGKVVLHERISATSEDEEPMAVDIPETDSNAGSAWTFE